MTITLRCLLALSVLSSAFTARAGLRPYFDLDQLTRDATDVVVVDDTGKVLEAWRGGFKAGDQVPLKDYRLTLRHKIGGSYLRPPPAGEPQEVTGKRMVMFLRRGGSAHDTQVHLGRLAPANWAGAADVSTVWIEGKAAHILQQHVHTSAPMEMTPFGTEEKLKTAVEAVDRAVREKLKVIRVERDPGVRAEKLAAVAETHGGFAGPLFDEIVKCGPAALPALRSLLDAERSDHPRKVEVYRAMARIGPAARADLMRVIGYQRHNWALETTTIGVLIWSEETELREYMSTDLAVLFAITENPLAWVELTAGERQVVKECRGFVSANGAAARVRKGNDRITDRLDRILDPMSNR